MKKAISILSVIMTLLFFMALPWLATSCDTSRKERFVCDITYTLVNNGNYMVVEQTDTIQAVYNHNWYGVYLKYFENPDDGEYKLKLYTDNYLSTGSTKTICVTSMPIICYSIHVHKLDKTGIHDNISH